MAEPLKISMVCPTCGNLLVGPKGPRAQLTDMLSCSEHGEVGRFEELIQGFSENASRSVEEAIKRLKGADSK